MATDEEIRIIADNMVKMTTPRQLEMMMTIARERDAALLKNRKKLIACINHMAQVKEHPETMETATMKIIKEKLAKVSKAAGLPPDLDWQIEQGLSTILKGVPWHANAEYDGVSITVSGRTHDWQIRVVAHHKGVTLEIISFDVKSERHRTALKSFLLLSKVSYA